MSDPFATLVIRRGDRTDHPRVRKDWVLSFATSSFAKFVTLGPDFPRRASQLYWDWQKPVIERLLARADLWVAAWAEDTTAIAGWCVLEGATVHYVYVGEAYRRHRVAARLLAPALEQSTVTYTHRTPVCRHLPIPAGWRFDPRPALCGQQEQAA